MIWKAFKNLEEKRFSDVQHNYLFTFWVNEFLIDQNIEDENYWRKINEDCSKYDLVFSIREIDISSGPHYRDVYEFLKYLFECNNNWEFISTFANLPKEELKKLKLDQNEPEKRKEIKKSLMTHLQTKVYYIEFDKAHLGLTLSKGYILISSSYFISQFDPPEQIRIKRSQLFLIIIHEFLHKLRILGPQNDYFDMENEGSLGVFDFNGEIGRSLF